MSRAAQILETLTRAGFDLEPTDDGRIVVEPGSRLSEADRAAIVAHKPELLRLLNRTGINARLVDAINRLCDLRGDDATNRQELIADSIEQARADRLDLIEHFTAQADQWARACGQPTSIN